MPTDWEARYQAAETPWDKSAAAPPLGEFLRYRSLGGSVLVPGCGIGHDVAVLAEQADRVLGLDLSPTAIRRARERYPAANIRFEVGDFLQPDVRFERAFDWVFEHTCLCALDPEQRPAYSEALREVLKPGGYLLAIFFRVVPDFDGEGPPWPIDGATIEHLFNPYFETIERSVPKSTYPERPYGSEELCLMRLR